MPKIAVTGKGGVGKTSFASMLAYVLAERGEKVVALDPKRLGAELHLVDVPGVDAILIARRQLQLRELEADGVIDQLGEDHIYGNVYEAAALGADAPATVAAYDESGEGLASRLEELALEALFFGLEDLLGAG